MPYEFYSCKNLETNLTGAHTLSCLVIHKILFAVITLMLMSAASLADTLETKPQPLKKRSYVTSTSLSLFGKKT